MIVLWMWEQGADYKGTGHFIYNNPPSYNVPDGLHVTNRNEATNWVVSQGAHLPAPDPEGKYVDLDLHDVELIKSGLSVWPKPPLDKPYNSYKCGRFVLSQLSVSICNLVVWLWNPSCEHCYKSMVQSRSRVHSKTVWCPEISIAEVL